jgi:Predicted hydrolase (metallo-beta-lactamase superfamily)
VVFIFSFTACTTPKTAAETATVQTSIAETTLLVTAAVSTVTETAQVVKETTAKTTAKVVETTTAETTAKETAAAQASETTAVVTIETTKPIPAGPLKVHFINVGQGDSILIQTPEGNTMLIDGGPKSSESSLVSYLQGQGVSKINLIVSTHPHEDHIGGLVSVINNFEVGNIIDSGVAQTTQTYKNYLSAIQSKNINFINWSVGQKFDFGKDVSFIILGPITKSSSDLNNSSIVIKLTYKNTTFLFAGDAQSTEEGNIISNGANLDSDVLKVGHHGSESSSSIKFLNAVSPAIAVISCGKGNSYGHPHDITLKKLAAIGATTYRTDLTGTIVIESDGTAEKVTQGSSYTYTAKEAETTQPSATSPPETTAPTETVATETPALTGQYVGSKDSEVFHYPNCSYVKNILPENMIWFSSRDDAIAQGKRPCKKCNP